MNRSMPPGSIIPELAYPDVRQATAWLCQVFGFAERLQIGTHRAQLVFGESSLIVTQQGGMIENLSRRDHAIMVRVRDVDGHFEQARQYGAKIVNPPTDYPFGERQYTTDDLAGHRWIFSQTITDVDPQSWGGIWVE